jgi:hypothetical protein
MRCPNGPVMPGSNPGGARKLLKCRAVALHLELISLVPETADQPFGSANAETPNKSRNDHPTI